MDLGRYLKKTGFLHLGNLQSCVMEEMLWNILIWAMRNLVLSYPAFKINPAFWNPLQGLSVKWITEPNVRIIQ